MADLMKKKSFIRGGENAIFSFDFTDAATKTGYILFYPCTSVDNSSTTRFLTTNPLPTAYGNSQIGQTTGTEDSDFDITFQAPATIRGICHMVWTTYVNPSSSSGYQTITVYHVRGGVETSLGTVAIANRTNANSGYRGECVKFTLTEKSFSVGDILRINIIHTASGGNTSQYYADPASSLTFTEATYSRTLSSAFKAYIPFKIDI